MKIGVARGLGGLTYAQQPDPALIRAPFLSHSLRFFIALFFKSIFTIKI